MKIPVHDRIIFRKVDIEQRSKGGLILTSTEQGEDRDVSYGEVISVGKGKELGTPNPIPMNVQEGDIIVFNERMPLGWKYKGEQLFIMRESDVLVILRDENLTVKEYTTVDASEFKARPKMLG